MDKKDNTLLFQKYKLAIQARNFHYDQFSKWLTYFYVAIGAIFIAYCKINSASFEHPHKDLIGIILLLLGYCCSMIWYLSSKGYYYWALNFIKIINHYEVKLLEWKEDERIYTMIAHKHLDKNIGVPYKESNFSTSKLSLLFAYLITFSWGSLLLNEFFAPTTFSYPAIFLILPLLILNYLIILTISVISQKFLHSDISDLHKLP